MLTGNILITGGAGFLARGIYERARREKWDARFTALSRDSHKHVQLHRDYPEVRTLQGDVSGDIDLLHHAMVGHDLVIHAAANKHVDECERNAWDTVRVNVFGSMNVVQAAIAAGVQRVIGISTDKACKPVTVYGHSKAQMERLFLEADGWQSDTRFHIVRYGNVLSSTGSVLPVWKKMLERDGYVTATSPNMTRFFMGVGEAVQVILDGLHVQSGCIYIHKTRALSMRQMREYLLPDAEFRYLGLRSIEKANEDLLAVEESPYANDFVDCYVLNPNGPRGEHNHIGMPVTGYSSDRAVSLLTRDELLEMLS